MLFFSPKSKKSELEKLTQELADRLFSDELNQKGFELMKTNIDLNHDGSITKEEYIRFCSDEEMQAKYMSAFSLCGFGRITTSPPLSP
jgi:tRNA G37 N-methylase Trm5